MSCIVRNEMKNVFQSSDDIDSLGHTAVLTIIASSVTLYI